MSEGIFGADLSNVCPYPDHSPLSALHKLLENIGECDRFTVAMWRSV